MEVALLLLLLLPAKAAFFPFFLLFLHRPHSPGTQLAPPHGHEPAKPAT
jgi:hypothetical protein